jgi:TolA-binding protein
LLSYRLIKLISLFIFTLFGCVYFNTFYNAETYFKKGMQTIEESAIEDSDEIPSKAKTQLEKAINKCNIVIEEFPDSDYIDDAYYIIGKSGFFRSEFTRAETSFNKLINDFPESEYINESKIWLAYTQFKLGDTDSSKVLLNNLLLIKRQSKNNKYLIHMALGDIYLEQDSIQVAFDHLDIAVKNAKNSGKRVSVYNKIISVAQKEHAFERAIKYLLLLEKQSDSPTIKKNARLKWIEFNKKLKNYDVILQEIDVMLGTAEYEAMYLDLELEKAKIYIERGDLVDGRSTLLSFLETTEGKKDNKTKKARAKSYFILGESSLFDEFDFSSAREYLELMQEEYNRSEFRVKSDKYQDLMNDFDKLKENYRKSLKLENVEIDTFNIEIDSIINEDIDTTYNIKNLDSLIHVSDSSKVKNDSSNFLIKNNKLDTNLNSLNMNMDFSNIPNMSGQNSLFDKMFNPENEFKKDGKRNKDDNNNNKENLKNDVEIIGTPDSLLMLLGEMLVYDFGLMDSAASRYRELVNQFPDSKFSPRAMYALTYYSPDSLAWKKEFTEKYPNPDFLNKPIEINDENEIKLDPQLILILNGLNENPRETRDSLTQFYNNNNNPNALYFSAYISDYFLNDIEFTKLYYKEFIDSFPSHEQFMDAKNRFEVIEQSILDTLPEIIDSTKSMIDISDSTLIQIDSTMKFNTHFDSLINKRKTDSNFDLLKGINIQLDSNFRKSEILRPQIQDTLKQ